MTSITLRAPPSGKATRNEDVIPLFYVLLGQRGAGILLRGHDGQRLNQTGGAVVSSTNYNIDVQSTIGKHAAFVLSATSATAAPTPANSAVLIEDTGLFLGAGKALRLYEVGGVDYAEATSADGALTLGGSGANAGVLNLTAIAIGTTPATAGSVRLNTTGSVTSRNTGNTANISMLSRAATDIVILGDGTNAVTTRAEAATDVRLRVGVTDAVTVTSSLFSTTLPVSTGATPATAGQVRIPSAGAINARNNANSANMSLMVTDGTDNLFIGDGTNTAAMVLRAATDFYLARFGATDYVHVGTRHALDLLKIAAPGSSASGWGSLYISAADRVRRVSSAGADALLAEEGGISLLLADTQYASIHSGTAITAVTETDVTSNLSFTVVSATSTIEIAVHGYAQMTMGAVGAATARLRLDSAGANTLYYLSGGRVQVINEFVNIFDGAGSLFITGLSASAHTIKVTTYTENNGNLYMRANGVESLRVTVVEHH